VAERTAEVEKLEQDVKRLEGELAAAKGGARSKPGAAQTNTGATTAAATASPVAQPAAPTPSAPASAPTSSAEEPAAAEQTSHEPPYFMTPPDSPAHPVWHWALGSFVVALGLGFALGWSMLDRRIRRKYGGLRIY
jgi:uncharacterized membrane protein